ncbi:hypothetical protein NLG97_g6764 [Lecanicillium saksenae]|uniref:Uncharacterized protein n=1 Tax=Lecanicillium saksenae TaxID=468837 RepID=A0ACC1QNR9_9HYPO|nr:hypothetical protein NLG97_g6764 [Lecanicillium saksenae]
MKFTLSVLALATAAMAAPFEEPPCGGVCTTEYAPVFCSNGLTYPNPCEADRARKCNPAWKDMVCVPVPIPGGQN